MVAHLGIVLPGRSYGPHAPVLHLPRLALQQVGAEVVVVSYDSDTSEQIRSVLDRAGADRVTFVTKSLGTMVLAGLDPGTVTLPERTEAIWLTPIFDREEVRQGAVAKGWRSLLVAGGADDYHDEAGHEEVRAALDAGSLVIPNASHSLEVPGDVLETVEAYRALAAAVLDFVGG